MTGKSGQQVICKNVNHNPNKLDLDIIKQENVRFYISKIENISIKAIIEIIKLQ